MKTFFISDLHLCEQRPHISKLFTRFLDEDSQGAEAIYILGDLFDSWIGDDQLDHDPLARKVASQLAQVARRGTLVFFMHGNRDFLIGERFARDAQVTLMADFELIVLEKQRILLMHGDTLCTDDIAYQQFRMQVRDPAWQADILGKSYAERVQLAKTIRTRSEVEKSMKADAIMDVNADAVATAFEHHQYPTLIHGHTHRPARHELTVNGQACTRWVLHDWHDNGGYLSSGDPHNGLTSHLIRGAVAP